MVIRPTVFPRVRLAALAALLALFLAAPVVAQEAAQEPETTKPIEVFDDWSVICRPIPEEAGGGEGCSAEFVVERGDGQPSAMRVAVGYLGETPVGAIVLPLGVILSEGVILRVDSNEELRLAFRQCTTAGCQVVFPLNEQILGQFKRGLAAVVVFLDPGGNPRTVDVSLKGFTAAFNTLGG